MASARALLPCLAVICLVGACNTNKPPSPGAVGPGARVEVLPLDDVEGLSGLAVDPQGTLYAVPEEQRLLVAVPQGGAAPRRIPVEGIPEGIETESLAWLGDGLFAAGTEGGCASGVERIFLLREASGRAHVERAIPVPLAPWPVPCDPHHGLEGLCAAQGVLVAAFEETLIGPDGARLAPIARVDESTGEVTPFRLTLGTKSGKISALDCRVEGDTIQLLAIERHFDVARLVAFSLPLRGPADAAPRPERMVADLFPHTDGGKRNFEGLAWLDARHVALLVDNHYRTRTGPNEVVYVELPAPPAQ